jgi:hypothetical protein
MLSQKHSIGPLILSVMLITAAMALAQIGLDNTRVPKGFITGKDWLGLSKTEQQLYAIGVVDGLDLASRVTDPRISLSWINQCVAGMSANQIRLWLKKEVEAAPDESTRLMVHWAMYRALEKTCDTGPR